MRHIPSVLALLPAVAFVAAAGCSRSGPAPPEAAGKTTPTVSPAEHAGGDAADDLSPITARLRVGMIRLGSELDASGDIAAGTDREEFTAGDPIFAALALEGIGAGSALSAAWIGPGETRLHEETAQVPRGATHLAFRAPETAAWAPGEYRVEIRLGDEVGGRGRFELRAPPVPGPAG
jgi:hypothetical protein